MRSLIRATAPKTPADIAAEWDAAAATRHAQITSGKDLSFSNVLKPAMLGLLDCCDRSRVLDVGCGTGELTREVALRAQLVTAVDLSATSIEVARTVCSDRNNVEFYVSAVEHLPSAFSSTPFSVGIAGMTLMTVPDLSELVRNLTTLIAPGGRFLATLLHPCFWPRYWGYEEAPWFEYRHEIFIEAPFQISLDSSDVVTTHIHRPLQMYVNVWAEAHFELESVRELRPSMEAERLYPRPWGYPRFLAMKWRSLA